MDPTIWRKDPAAMRCSVNAEQARSVFVGGPMLLDYSAAPCWTAHLKYAFDTTTSSYLQQLPTAARIECTQSSRVVCTASFSTLSHTAVPCALWAPAAWFSILGVGEGGSQMKGSIVQWVHI